MAQPYTIIWCNPLGNILTGAISAITYATTTITIGISQQHEIQIETVFLPNNIPRQMHKYLITAKQAKFGTKVTWFNIGIIVSCSYTFRLTRKNRKV